MGIARLSTVQCMTEALVSDKDSDNGDCTRRWVWPICWHDSGFHQGMSQSFQGRPTLVDHVLAIREEIKLLRAIEATDLSQAQTIEQAISLIIKTYSTDPRE